MELIMAIHSFARYKKLKYKISFISDPVCWTEVPTSLKDLAKQRNRWHSGLCESLWKYKFMFLNPRYGVLGFISMPYFFIFDFFGVIFETMGYFYVFGMLSLGILNFDFFMLFFILAILSRLNIEIKGIS